MNFLTAVGYCSAMYISTRQYCVIIAATPWGTGHMCAPTYEKLEELYEESHSRLNR